MRLFFAINFSPAARIRLAGLRDGLRSAAARGSFCDDANLHMTLVFIGECDARMTATAKEALDGLAFCPFDISIGRLDRFERDGGDIWWAGVAETPALSALHRGLSDRLAAAGFTLENRRYRPHITLSRETITDVQPHNIEPFGQTVMSVELMKSERIGGRLVYTPIHAKTGGGV